jgi:hypothetical protein
MVKERLLHAILKESMYIHHGDNVLKIRDMFSRKQQNTGIQDDKFFAKYWQVYAWAALIGFLNNKREFGASLPHDRSFEFLRIWNGSEMIANSLVLMAIAKMESNEIEDILNARKIVTIISEYAEGGAKHILEIRQTPGMEQKFNYSSDYFDEIIERGK